LAYLPVIVFLSAWGFLLNWESVYLFKIPPQMLCIDVYELNPFLEAMEISEYIRAHSAPDSRIAVLGSEPEIYFYSRRRSATGYIYGYDLMLPHKYSSFMQREMIREIEEVKPEFLVLVNDSRSWTVWSKSDKTIFRWGNKYADQFYDLVGAADLIEPGNTIFHWDNEASKHPIRSNYFILIYKRKPSV
jgi:hypothetical protein